ncbi:MAG: amidohydrolase family protein [Armatimonadota bacterium]
MQRVTAEDLPGRKVRHLGRGDRIILVNASLPLDSDGGRDRRTVVIEGGRIAEMRADGDRPDGYEVIDLSGRYLLPGLIDAHVHFTGDEHHDPYRRYIAPRDTARTIRAALDAHAVLSAGYTTVRSLGHANSEIVYGLRDCINAGVIDGPRILTAGWAISQTAGHGNLRIWPYGWVSEMRPRSAFADGEADLRKLVRFNFGEGADLVKIYTTEGVITSPPKFRNKVNFTIEEIRVVVDEAHMRGAKVSAHATSVEGVRNAVLAGVDTIEHGPREAHDEVLAMMKERGTFLVPTLSVYHWALADGPQRGFAEEILTIIRQEQEGTKAAVARARELGVRIVAGSDTSTRPKAGLNVTEIELLSGAGLGPDEAHRAATWGAAEALGVQEYVGTIAPGRLADLIVVRENPLRNVSSLKNPGNIEMIFRSREVIA